MDFSTRCYPQADGNRGNSQSVQGEILQNTNGPSRRMTVCRRV